MKQNEKIEILGVNVDRFSISELNKEVSKIIEKDEKRVIGNHNLHSVYLFHTDEKFREFYELAEFIHIDGMPIIWAGKLLKKNVSKTNRITYNDWIHPLLKKANKYKWKIFYLGSKPGVAKQAVSNLSGPYPNIQFNTRHGYFDMNDEENKEVLKQIDDFSPDILMVGMGMPRQEYWILENYEFINANVILDCGACFDYIAGEADTPPRILGSLGFEWLYRLLKEPGRLHKRYLIEPFLLLWALLKKKF